MGLIQDEHELSAYLEDLCSGAAFTSLASDAAWQDRKRHVSGALLLERAAEAVFEELTPITNDLYCADVVRCLAGHLGGTQPKYRSTAKAIDEELGKCVALKMASRYVCDDAVQVAYIAVRGKSSKDLAVEIAKLESALRDLEDQLDKEHTDVKTAGKNLAAALTRCPTGLLGRLELEINAGRPGVSKYEVRGWYETAYKRAKMEVEMRNRGIANPGWRCDRCEVRNADCAACGGTGYVHRIIVDVYGNVVDDAAEEGVWVRNPILDFAQGRDAFGDADVSQSLGLVLGRARLYITETLLPVAKQKARKEKLRILCCVIDAIERKELGVADHEGTRARGGQAGTQELFELVRRTLGTELVGFAGSTRNTQNQMVSRYVKDLMAVFVWANDDGEGVPA